MKRNLALLACCFFLGSCSDKKSSGSGGSAYSFTSAISARLLSSNLSSLLQTQEYRPQTLPNSCTDNLCYTPTALTGKYYAVGLLIQSTGSGMTAYFGQGEWSNITGTSTTYDFDFASPVTQTGNLVCCSGSGDLSNENTYFSEVIYLFAYLDATFTVPGTSQATGTALGSHTVRFIMADDAVTGAKRGDLMYSDSGTFKWMDSSGNLTTTRPTSPIVMNTSVVNWTNPYGDDKGNQSIPVLGVQINPPTGGGVYSTTEAGLKTVGRTYSFDFDASGMIFFPTTLTTDTSMLTSRQALLERIHLQGLPHSGYGDGQASAAGKSTLTITEPSL